MKPPAGETGQDPASLAPGRISRGDQRTGDGSVVLLGITLVRREYLQDESLRQSGHLE